MIGAPLPVPAPLIGDGLERWNMIRSRKAFWLLRSQNYAVRRDGPKESWGVEYIKMECARPAAVVPVQWQSF
jgi:hypothetical protein